MKKVFVFPECSDKLADILHKCDCEILKTFSDDADYVISVGGDGTFLRACKAMGFSNTPILGINTGHLGFFTMLSPNQLDLLPSIINDQNYSLQEYKLINTYVETDTHAFNITPALNDVQVRHWKSTLIHLKIYVGDKYIENFNGDGILVSSAAGSTAYNYSLKGSVVDPRVELLQVTPIAPANNAAYRSLMSSIILPPEQHIVIEPQAENEAVVIADGKETQAKNIRKISMWLSDKSIRLVRTSDYDFWAEVKDKML